MVQYSTVLSYIKMQVENKTIPTKMVLSKKENKTMVVGHGKNSMSVSAVGGMLIFKRLIMNSYSEKVNKFLNIYLCPYFRLYPLNTGRLTRAMLWLSLL